MERLTDDTGTGLPSTLRADKKIEILPGAAPDGSACTFCIHEEDHTIGNALRYIIMKNPDVEFCGYSAPHPSEPKIHLRVQMYDGKSAIDAVALGLDNLETIFTSIGEKYAEDLAAGEYDTTEETFLDLASVKKLRTTGGGVDAEDVSMAEA